MTQKLGQMTKIWPKIIQMVCSSFKNQVICQIHFEKREIDFENVRILNFQGLAIFTLTLKCTGSYGIPSFAHHSSTYNYTYRVHAKFHSLGEYTQTSRLALLARLSQEST